MNDNENKTNAPTIKLPVRYDAEAKFIRGDDQRWVCDCDNPIIANQIVAALNEADALRAEVEEMNELFQAQWEADMRAVKLWQDATPGKEFTLPDRTNHVVWLLNRIEFDEKIYAEMREENERLKSELAAIKPNAAAGE